MHIPVCSQEGMESKVAGERRDLMPTQEERIAALEQTTSEYQSVLQGRW